ncbi:MAG: hypothetical protein PPP58_11965, partial [Natronomonas sp.]
MGSVNSIHGRVRDGSNEPAEGRIVIARESSEEEPAGHWITAADGTFSGTTDGGTDVDPGSLSYTVRNPMRGGSEERILGIESDGDAIEVTIATSGVQMHGMTEHRGMTEEAKKYGMIESHRFHTQFPTLDTYERDESFLRDLGGAEYGDGGGLSGPMVESA